MRCANIIVAVLICVAPMRSDNVFAAAGAESGLGAGKYIAPTKEALELLFARLKASKTIGEGRTIEADIWQHWGKSGRGDIDKLMKQSRLLAARGHYGPAIGLLDRVIFMMPEYVEGWNRRATVYFFMKSDDASLKDIKKVLELEPRHFGALAGKGLIHLRMQNWREALTALRIAVEIHPFLREKDLIPDLERKLNIREL